MGYLREMKKTLVFSELGDDIVNNFILPYFCEFFLSERGT